MPILWFIVRYEPFESAALCGFNEQIKQVTHQHECSMGCTSMGSDRENCPDVLG